MFVSPFIFSVTNPSEKDSILPENTCSKNSEPVLLSDISPKPLIVTPSFSSSTAAHITIVSIGFATFSAP